jgi:hypothetical protein
MKETLVIYDKACVDSIDNTDEFLKEVINDSYIRR